MFVVMKINTWTEIGLDSNLPFPVSLNLENERSMGYLLVYKTLEDLFEDFPGETNYLEVQPIEK